MEAWPLAEGRAYPASSLEGALSVASRVAYTTNGNRIGKPARYLRALLPAMRRCGITRVANVSHLPTEAFPVFQTTRPAIVGHHTTGQNTGGQGKGPTDDQARISAIMEAIEGYCAEPREVSLVRSSYRQLRAQHAILDPNAYVRYDDDAPIDADEPLMWTEAYSLALRRSLLVPAEAVFVPFSPTDFDTLPHFPRSTNGLASGATVLEAVTHGLYEVIERYFLDLFQRGEARAELVADDQIARISPRIRKFLDDFDRVFVAGVFRIVAKQTSKVLTTICRIRHRELGFFVQGSGASSVASVAIERSVSEAIQSFAVAASGSREDLGLSHHGPSSARIAAKKKESPARAASFKDRTFADLRDELDFLTREIGRYGYPNVFVAQLTRVGIDVPVTKVIVPGMPVPQALRQAVGKSMLEPNRLTRLRYGVGLG